MKIFFGTSLRIWNLYLQKSNLTFHFKTIHGSHRRGCAFIGRVPKMAVLSDVGCLCLHCRIYACIGGFSRLGFLLLTKFIARCACFSNPTCKYQLHSYFYSATEVPFTIVVFSPRGERMSLAGQSFTKARSLVFLIIPWYAYRFFNTTVSLCIYFIFKTFVLI